MWAPAEKRVQREKQCGKENRERQVPMAPPWMPQVAPFCGEGAQPCVHKPSRVHVCSSSSLCGGVRKRYRNISSFDWSCPLSADVCWALSGAGSALGAEAGCRVEGPAPGARTPWLGCSTSPAVPRVLGASSALSQSESLLLFSFQLCPAPLNPRKTFIIVLTNAPMTSR